MPIKKLKEFLDSHDVKYVTISHSRAYTAQEVAASAHIPGKTLAKIVIVKVDDRMAMAVLPATHKVDFNLLCEAKGCKVELATEKEFKDIFPECEIGAMPPFDLASQHIHHNLLAVAHTQDRHARREHFGRRARSV